MKRPNVGLIVASMLVSVLLWLQVRSEAALQTTRKIDLPLRYVNLDEEMYVVRNLPKSIAAQVEGTAEQIDRFTSLKAGTVVATVDLSDANPEITTYRVRLPRSEAIQRTGADLRALSDDVFIIIEEVAIKESSVTIDPYNAPAGLMFSTAEVSPEKVRLRGPMGDLARVDQVRARFDLSQAPGRGVTYRSRFSTRTSGHLKRCGLSLPRYPSSPSSPRSPPPSRSSFRWCLPAGASPHRDIGWSSSRPSRRSCRSAAK